MLKQKIRINKNVTQEEIPFDNIYVHPEGLFISGVTRPISSDERITEGHYLADGDEVIVNTATAIDTYTAKAEITSVTRQGFVKTYDSYPIQYGEFEQDRQLNEIEYIEINGDFVYRVDDEFWIDETTKGEVVNNIVYVPTIHWIDNNSFNVDGINYEVDFNSEYYESDGGEFYNFLPTIYNEAHEVVTEINGKLIEITPYDKEDWYEVLYVIIRRRPDEILDVNGAACGAYSLYCKINSENVYVKPLYNGDELLGLGCLVDEEPYTISGQTVSGNTIWDNGQIVNEHTIPSAMFIKSNIVGKEDTLPIYSEIQSVYNGTMVLLFVDNNDLVTEHDVVIATTYDKTHELAIQSGIDDREYVIFNNNRYYLEDRLYDTIQIGTDEYVLEYITDDLTNAVITIDGNDIPLVVTKKNGVLTAKHKYPIPSKNNSGHITYGIQTEEYNVFPNKGVIINGKRYKKTELTLITPNSGDTHVVTKPVVIINDKEELPLRVTDKQGNGLIVCTPILNWCQSLPFEEKNELRRNICRKIVGNASEYTFFLRDDVFGALPVNYRTALDIAVNRPTNKIIHNSNEINVFPHFVSVYRKTDYVTIPLSLVQTTAPNLMQDEVLKAGFMASIYESGINGIIDMERDIYTPKIKQDDKFIDIQELKFNLHFRTRDLNTWEKYNFITADGIDLTNWFITDYEPYQNVFNKKQLQSSGDLIGLANFSNGDVFYQKNKLAKSFLRLAVYTSPDPNTQILLHTSTIFLDEHRLYHKFIQQSQSDLGIIKRTGELEKTTLSHVLGEALNEKGQVVINDNQRLDCSFSVENKHISNTSSEGFYWYIFKEYCRGLHEFTVYLRIEFNHAGVGKTLPFYLPMKWENDEAISALSIENPTDLDILKTGCPLKEINQQLYIPVRVKYDTNSKGFVYFFDGPYATAINNGEKLVLNLFELKIKDES